MQSFINRWRDTKITFQGWLLGFAAIFFVRFLLENLSSPPANGAIASDWATIVHVGFFFLGVVLALLLVLKLIVKDHEDAERFLLLGLPIIWLAPVLDLIYSGGKGFVMGYPLRDNTLGILVAFFDYFGKASIFGLTPGIKVEVMAVMVGICLFVFAKTRTYLKAAFAAIAAYAVIFIWSQIPSVIKIVHDAVSGYGRNLPATEFFINSLGSGLTATNFLHPTISLSYARMLEVIGAAAISQFYYILILFLFAVYLYLTRRKKLVHILCNSRFLRVGYYWAMIVVGFFLSGGLADFARRWNWADIVSLIVLFLTYYCAWMFAVGVNDIADLEIDKISNAARPLARGDITEEDAKSANLFFLVAALIGGFLSGHYVLFMIIVALALSYIYSAPPLRFRVFPLLPSLLIALASLSTVFSGFFLLSPDKTIRAFPISYAALIVMTLALIVNLRDTKDIKGDAAAGVQTIPVIFGEKMGKRIVSLLAAVAFLLPPAMLHSRALLWPSLLAAALGYILINRRPYREWPLFVLGFLYLVSVAVLSGG